MTAQSKDELITLLWDSLKRDPEHKDRRQTGWGTKTKQRLIASIERIVVGGQQESGGDKESHTNVLSSTWDGLRR